LGRKTFQGGRKLGLDITRITDDAHYPPFAHNQFVVASPRHAACRTKMLDSFGEIKRSLKPGGRYFNAA